MVLLVFAVLASLFESYAQPLVILIAVPLSWFGSIPLLYLTGTPVTLGARIGIIMLGGIVVNNSIMLVDAYNHIRKSKGKYRALLESGPRRLRPVMMTSLTFILAQIPLLFDRDGSGTLWAPMALTVIGGLGISTILVLLVLPGIYLFLGDIRSYFRRFLHSSPNRPE